MVNKLIPVQERLLVLLKQMYSRSNSTNSPASGTGIGNVGEPRLMSHVW
jgi:hypothetical protein